MVPFWRRRPRARVFSASFWCVHPVGWKPTAVEGRAGGCGLGVGVGVGCGQPQLDQPNLNLLRTALPVAPAQAGLAAAALRCSAPLVKRPR